MSEEARARETELEEQIDEATGAVEVQTRELDELAGGPGTGEALGVSQLLDVPVEVTVEVGSTRLTLGELVKLGPGSLLQLDREAHEPADILVNGKAVARGEIVTVGDSYGVRITSTDL